MLSARDEGLFIRSDVQTTEHLLYEFGALLLIGIKTGRQKGLADPGDALPLVRSDRLEIFFQI